MTFRPTRPTSGLLCAAALMVAACSGQGSYPVVVDQVAAAARAQAALVSVGGHVIAPAGIIATGAGNLIATGAGNLIATGAGNLIATGAGNLTSRQLMSLAEVPLVGADVYLADAAGAALPHTPHATTQADGGYSLGNVPAGFTYVVAVKAKDKKGKEFSLLALAHTTNTGATADVSLASTCVTTDAVNGRTQFGDIDQPAYLAARDALAARLSESSQPDVADRDAILSFMRNQEGSASDVHDTMNTLRNQLDRPRSADPLPLFPSPAPAPSGVTQAPHAPPTKPPVPSTKPGELPYLAIGGQLLDANAAPLANVKLQFTPQGDHHEAYPPVTTDAQGYFLVDLRYSQEPDSFDVAIDGKSIGLWVIVLGEKSTFRAVAGSKYSISPLEWNK